MNNFIAKTVWKLKDRKAQILLPSVLLAPIFILVIYLLFEMVKVSVTKIREQFALDNAAYSQISAASTYLNAVAMTNGPLPYRVMLFYDNKKITATNTAIQKGMPPQISVFDIFYKGGAVPAIGPDYESGLNPPPAPESNDWGVQYYEGQMLNANASRKDWQKEQPNINISGDDPLPVISEELVKNYHFSQRQAALPAIVDYLQTYLTVGDIYGAQRYSFEQVSKNAIMYREAYFLNVRNCKRADCARQSASKIRQFINLQTVPVELNKIMVYMADSDGSNSAHGGALALPLEAKDWGGKPLFQFAYVAPSSRTKLRTLSRGVMLKQNYKLPANHFNINLEQKYKPYVRNEVVLSCPRNNNNCVWPNPLPKYSVTLNP